MIELQDSFVRAKSWVKELQRLANTNIVIALAGNKADLASKRTVEFEVICDFCYLTPIAYIAVFLVNSKVVSLQICPMSFDDQKPIKQHFISQI